MPFDPAGFHREEALVWVFSRVSDPLVEQGHIPGAVFASVDKLDGHVWSEAEQEAFYAPA